MKAEIENTVKAKGKKEGTKRLTELKIAIPVDALELVSSTVILDLDTTSPDKVIVNLGQGVDIVKPGESSEIVLTEKVYRIRKPSRRLALPPVKSE